MNISATQLSKRPNMYMEAAMQEPVVVEKNRRPAIVLVAYDRYLELEDAYWGNLASKADVSTSNFRAAV